MKNIKIKIKRSAGQMIRMNENQAGFINQLRGRDAFLKRAAADFLRKKKIYEAKRDNQNPDRK